MVKTFYPIQTSFSILGYFSQSTTFDYNSGSGTSSLTNLQAAINEQAVKGYRLHTISTTSSGSKGFLGGDKIQATMVFERIDAFISQ